MLQKGASMLFTEEPNDTQRCLENSALIDYNNHKKARDNEDILAQQSVKEVVLGFACVIPISNTHIIPNYMVVPLEIAKQHSID
jgi:hypothetical protein